MGFFAFFFFFFNIILLTLPSASALEFWKASVLYSLPELIPTSVFLASFSKRNLHSGTFLIYGNFDAKKQFILPAAFTIPFAIAEGVAIASS